MSRVWFSQPLETVATWWRILRRDGVTLGFISHDRDLWFDGVLHRAAPGMVPSAIRRSAGLDDDSAEVAGALSHDAVSAADLAAGRFDGARVRIGLIDWQTGEQEAIWTGTLGAVTEEDGGFIAELASNKAELFQRAVPRTSPSCRAAFCGPGCDLNPAFFTHEAALIAIDPEDGAVTIACAAPSDHLVGGTLRWLDGPNAGRTALIQAMTASGALVLDPPLEPAPAPGTPALVPEGCDHSLDTCATRFANAAQFRGEPFLHGNDLLVRYPASGALTGLAIANAARDLVGTGFRLHGRDPATGLDCLGVVLAALAEAGRPAPLLPQQALRTRDTAPVEAMARSAGLVPASGDIAAGDVLLVRCSPVQLHLLVAVDGEAFVHAHAALRRVVLGARDPAWPLVAHWRLPETD